MNRHVALIAAWRCLHWAEEHEAAEVINVMIEEELAREVAAKPWKRKLLEIARKSSTDRSAQLEGSPYE